MPGKYDPAYSAKRYREIIRPQRGHVPGGQGLRYLLDKNERGALLILKRIDRHIDLVADLFTRTQDEVNHMDKIEITQLPNGWFTAPGMKSYRSLGALAEAIPPERWEALAAAFIAMSGKSVHSSNCATSIAPAYRPAPCDCNA